MLKKLALIDSVKNAIVFDDTVAFFNEFTGDTHFISIDAFEWLGWFSENLLENELEQEEHNLLASLGFIA